MKQAAEKEGRERKAALKLIFDVLDPKLDTWGPFCGGFLGDSNFLTVTWVFWSWWIPERLVRPDRLRYVLVDDGQQVLLRDLLHAVEALAVDQAGSHQVGRVVVLPEVVQLVAQVAPGAVGGRGRRVHREGRPAPI